MSKHGQKIALTSAVAVVLALVGCTNEPAPVPEVSWSPSEPAGAYDDTDWVQAIRTYNLEWSLAFNTHDFTSPTLVALVGSSQVKRLAAELQHYAEDEEYVYFPGPLPFAVIDLTDDGDTARATVCRPNTDWLISLDHPEPSIDSAFETIYNLVRTESGSVRIESSGTSERPCDLSDASIGLFDPEPDLTATYSPNDVKAP